MKFNQFNLIGKITEGNCVGYDIVDVQVWMYLCCIFSHSRFQIFPYSPLNPTSNFQINSTTSIVAEAREIFILDKFKLYSSSRDFLNEIRRWGSWEINFSIPCIDDIPSYILANPDLLPTQQKEAIIEENSCFPLIRKIYHWYPIYSRWKYHFFSIDLFQWISLYNSRLFLEVPSNWCAVLLSYWQSGWAEDGRFPRNSIELLRQPECIHLFRIFRQIHTVWFERARKMSLSICLKSENRKGRLDTCFYQAVVGILDLSLIFYWFLKGKRSCPYVEDSCTF